MDWKSRNTVASMATMRESYMDEFRDSIAMSSILRKGRNFLVVGPSGVGKTRLATAARKAGRRAVDLDVVGYRTDDTKWKEWIIPPAILDVLRQGPDTVAVGACSNIDELLTHAHASGWKIIFLTCTVADLRDRRTRRGDKPEKVENAMEDLISWDARYESYRQLLPNVTSARW